MFLKDELLEVLQNNLSIVRFTASRDEISIRCPYCGDSIKNDKHTHLYINITNKNNIFPYYCQKCNSSGIIGYDFLKDLKIYNTTLGAHLEKQNKAVLSSFNKINFKDSSYIREIIVPEYEDTENESSKLNYINNRYSFKLDPEVYTDKYKIIFSFENFLVANEISKINCSEFVFNQLNNQYIGFLSQDNSFIIFRNIDKNCDKKSRYYMYSLNNDFGERYYMPRTQIDLMSLNTKLILTEGIFDIIGVNEYFVKGEENVITASVNGKGYLSLLNKFQRMGILILGIEIYSDADVGIGFFKYLQSQNLMLLYNKVTIYYNDIEKDFGVPKSKIKLKKVNL